MTPHFNLLGWTAHQVELGTSDSNPQNWRNIGFGLRLGDIRNCSYAVLPKWISVAAEDRTNGGHVISVYNLQSGMARVLLRFEYVLLHSLNQAGSKACYTRPSALGTADLHVYEVAGDRDKRVAEGSVAQDSTPVWFPDSIHIGFHSPAGQIQILDSIRGQVETLGPGYSPAITPGGELLAFQRDNQLWLSNLRTKDIRPLTYDRSLQGRTLVNGLSWSSAGTHLSFGIISGAVDKQVTFFLLEVSTGKCQKVAVEHLRGLLVVDI
jgi:hypothetical protein